MIPFTWMQHTWTDDLISDLWGYNWRWFGSQVEILRLWSLENILAKCLVVGTVVVEQAGRIITEGRNKGEKEIPGRERAFLFFCSLFETPLPRQPILPQAIAFFCPRQKIILLRGSHAGCVEWITFTVQSVKCKIWQGMESRIQFMCINLSLWNPIFGFVFCVFIHPYASHNLISW
jgi:hypothetical protein